MPTLDWIGKDKVINHHMEVPYRVLDEQYSYGEDSENMIIHGDNLSALKSLLPQYEGRIKCIYIDPPYNTGNEGWVYNDNVNDPHIKKWLGEVVGTEGVDLSRHDKWLCMMYPRLKLLHRLLSDDGIIFISINDVEMYNLKMICDEIFGTGNFLANFIWQSTPGSNTGLEIKTVTEYVLCYAKVKNMCTTSSQIVEGDEKKYNLEDEYVERRGRYKLNKLDRRMTGQHYSDALNYPIETPDGTMLYPGSNIEKQPHWNWRWSQSKVQWGIENGFIVFKKIKETWAIYFKQYFNVDNNDEIIQRALPYQNLIKDLDGANSARGTQEVMRIFESKIFDYPKPLNLIKHLLKIYANNNSIVLDSFAGSGTTAHAVLNMNKADGGNRKFILIEMCDYAETITAERVKRVIDGYGEGKKKVDGTGGGFKFYELGEKLLNGEYLNENVGTDKIREYVYFTETKQPIENKSDEPYFMGKYFSTAYYFYYEKNAVTTLDRAFMHTVKTNAESYLIYADKCIISDEELEKNHIKFKKIPRDITKL